MCQAFVFFKILFPFFSISLLVSSSNVSVCFLPFSVVDSFSFLFFYIIITIIFVTVSLNFIVTP